MVNNDGVVTSIGKISQETTVPSSSLITGAEVDSGKLLQLVKEKLPIVAEQLVKGNAQSAASLKVTHFIGVGVEATKPTKVSKQVANVLFATDTSFLATGFTATKFSQTSSARTIVLHVTATQAEVSAGEAAKRKAPIEPRNKPFI